ncbi:TetR/AcrR family transcriptional regulator [Sphingomonas sp. ST-64]|uniref:TetR/AcrR family transcriptional regulator n=1 Tax=Sphingomonas plantiphila TaxID=3163295 RepID=A0ABW8YU98_9SPHN
MEAARHAFFTRGFQAATIEDIAQAAEVSKVTVYSRFGDKETLFEEVMRDQSARMAMVFDQAVSEDRSLEEQLNAYGLGLLNFMFSEDHVAIDRVLMHEIAQVPELARRFYEAGPALCFGRLAEVLSDAAARGQVEVDDPYLAAQDLCGLWKGVSDMGLKLGLEPLPDAETIRKRVERATRLFLRMIGSKA